MINLLEEHAGNVVTMLYLWEIMERHSLTEALPADHHFEHAGANILLK